LNLRILAAGKFGAQSILNYRWENWLLSIRAQEFCSKIGASAACSVRMALAGNQDREPGIKSGCKGDSWFGSVTCADELESRNKKAVLSKYILEKFKDAPGGTHIVLSGIGLKGTPLIAFGYRYYSKATLCFYMYPRCWINKDRNVI